MSVISNHSAVQFFELPFLETELEAWVVSQRQALPGEITFGLVFCSQETCGHAHDILEIVQIYAQTPVVIGCNGSALVANGHEFESETGFTVALYHLPNTRAVARHIPVDRLLADDARTALLEDLGEGAARANAWMLFAAAESIGTDAWLADWDAVTGGAVTVGGFASGDLLRHNSALFCDGEVHSEGLVALSLEGEVTIEPVLAQGCRPIGTPWTVTRAEHNVIHQIGNRPILEVLRDTLAGMSREDQKRARGNIFVGVVLDEYKAEFSVGDFLVRNLAAIDPKTGAIAIATPLRTGQNVQFQIRDAECAAAGFEEMLEQKLFEVGRRPIYGSCLCDCIGRGATLFGVPDHDVSVVAGALPELPVAGVFCNGEFATMGGQTSLHGYAASLALFVQKR